MDDAGQHALIRVCGLQRGAIRCRNPVRAGGNQNRERGLGVLLDIIMPEY